MYMHVTFYIKPNGSQGESLYSLKQFEKSVFIDKLFLHTIIILHLEARGALNFHSFIFRPEAEVALIIQFLIAFLTVTEKKGRFICMGYVITATNSKLRIGC